MLKLVLVSLGIVLAISAGIGFVFANLIGFWQGFIAAVIIQFVATYGIATFKTSQKEEVQVDEAQQLINLQTVEVACPCTNVVTQSPIFFGLNNEFVCNKCNSKFRVELSYESVLVTEPLNLENAYNFLKSKEQS
jgi:transposase-like protein